MTGRPWLDMSLFAETDAEMVIAGRPLDELRSLFQAALGETSAGVEPARWQTMLYVAVAPPDVLDTSRAAFDDWTEDGSPEGELADPDTADDHRTEDGEGPYGWDGHQDAGQFTDQLTDYDTDDDVWSDDGL